jgi:hypothetical protein
VVEAFGVPYVWVMAAGLTLVAGLSLLGVPPHRPGVEAAVDREDLAESIGGPAVSPAT